MYNFLSSSSEYLKQKSYIDFSKFQEHFITPNTQIFSKTYIYGGKSLGKMLDKLASYPRIDIIRGEVGIDDTEKGTDVNLAVGMLTKAFHNTYDVGILLSGDRDYIKLIRQLRRMGKIIIIAVPDGKPLADAQKLINAADGHIVLNEEFYKKYWLKDIYGEYTSKINDIVE